MSKYNTYIIFNLNTQWHKSHKNVPMIASSVYSIKLDVMCCDFIRSNYVLSIGQMLFNETISSPPYIVLKVSFQIKTKFVYFPPWKKTHKKMDWLKASDIPHLQLITWRWRTRYWINNIQSQLSWLVISSMKLGIN